MDDEKTVREYERSVGHGPQNLPDDHPDHWQWVYRGTKEDKEKLRSLLGIPDEDEPVVIDGQESLL